jgi:hypothetical protein
VPTTEGYEASMSKIPPAFWQDPEGDGEPIAPPGEPVAPPEERSADDRDDALADDATSGVP